MKKILRWIPILLLMAAAYLAVHGYGRWYARKEPPQASERRILYYVDPMHPAYKSDKPGIAPDCGMKLVPVYAEPDPAKTDHSVHGAAEKPPGTVQISPEKQQLIGVRYGTVEYASGARSIRAAGKVAYDETRLAHVHSKVEGWIENVFVDFTGKLVEKGQPLLTIYSPELLATQQEFLLALKARDVMKQSTMASAMAHTESLLDATRKRLELWDLTEAQIDEIARRQQPAKNITLYAPISGYVLVRNAFPRQRIMPDTDLYTVVDLSKIWVIADVFEYEAPFVRVGQPAVVSLAYDARKTVRGTVSYIQPLVDPTTRTLKVRIELDNPGLALKPDMFADVELRIPSPQRLSVPAEAVLDSGRIKTVFVDRGEGYLEPRQVETGERFGDRIEILKGLKAGQRIVTSGTFLIDSESQLKAAAEGMRHEH